jgi:hypothetical protein
VRNMAAEFCLRASFHARRVLLHAANLRHGTPGSIKDGKFLDRLRDYWLSKKALLQDFVNIWDLYKYEGVVTQ